jgi:hypothetical protein
VIEVQQQAVQICLVFEPMYIFWRHGQRHRDRQKFQHFAPQNSLAKVQ